MNRMDKIILAIAFAQVAVLVLAKPYRPKYEEWLHTYLTDEDMEHKVYKRADSCSIAPENRTGCGWQGISQRECEKRGCCFDSNCFVKDPISLNKVYPRDHTTVEGANLTLQCKVTGGNPRPKITWHSVTGNITALSHGKNLTFFNISRSDAGQYFCVAENGVEQAVPSRISSIDVQYPPKLNPNYPRDYSVLEGEAVSMRCVVEESNPYPKISWIKLDDPETLFPSGVNLNLSDVVHGDEGKYRCLAENGVGRQIWSRVARVEVQRRSNNGSTAARKDDTQIPKRGRLIIILLSAAVAMVITAVLLMAIFWICLVKTSGLLDSTVAQPRSTVVRT